MATINEMRQVATQIENETQVGGNTAERVGGLFNDIVDNLEEDDTNLDAVRVEMYNRTSFPITPTVSILGTGTKIANGVITSGNSSDWRVRYIPVSIGQVVNLTTRASASKEVTCGFCASAPAVGVSVANTDVQNGRQLSFTKVSEINGYFVFAFYSSSGSSVTYTITKSSAMKDDYAVTKEIAEEEQYRSNIETPFTNGAKISIMGNSICTFANYLTPSWNHTKYPASDVTDVSQTWWWQVIKSLKGTLEINNSYSGGRVTNTDGNSSSYIYRYNSGGIGNADMLLLWGGINDMRNGTIVGTLDFSTPTAELDESIFASAYDKLVRLIISDHPSCKIVAIIEPFLDEDYKNVIKEVANHYNLFALIDLSNYGEAIGRFDSLHPNAEGMRYIAKKVAEDITDSLIKVNESSKLQSNSNILEAYGNMNSSYVVYLTRNTEDGSSTNTERGNVLHKKGRPLIIELNGYITSNRSTGELYFALRFVDKNGNVLETILEYNIPYVFVPKRFVYTPQYDGYIYAFAHITGKRRARIKVIEPFYTANELQEIVELNGLQSTAGYGQSGNHSYVGQRVSFKDVGKRTYTYDIKTVNCVGVGGYNGNAAQGFTYYDGVGFAFYDAGYCQTINLSDMDNASIISSFALPSGVQNPNNHCGQANWGEFYDPTDRFPLLYLSSYLEKCCYVLRMTTTGATLIQTLYLKDENDSLLDAQAFFVDGERLVIKMGGYDSIGYAYKYWKVFNMPSPTWGENGVFYLEDKQKIDEFYMRTISGELRGNKNYYNAGFAMNGKIYVLAGFDGSRQRLLVIDYEKHSILSDVDWDATAMTSNEQEQCCRVDDKTMLINYNGADKFMRVTFQ